MNNNTSNMQKPAGTTLVLGGTGKTGRRVAERLKARGIDTRIASRSVHPAFDWNDSNNWNQILKGVTSVYISYAPDLAIPGATDAIRHFVELAVTLGVQRLVLLSGRGEQEAQECERIVQATDVQWTIVRASWFMQNFSEGEFLNMVQQGAITLPAGDIHEPFIDVNDIADVAAAALSEEGHAYEIYEVTGPRLMTFKQLAQELSEVTGRGVQFVEVTREDFNQAISKSGAPADIAWLLNYLFETVLDGRNACLSDGVQRALGREPSDFKDFVRRSVERGVWNNHNGENAA